MKEIVSEIYDKLGDISGQGKEMIKAHCSVVAAIAKEIAINYQQKTGKVVDMDLIEAGAMIHDVGWLGIEITKSIVHGEAGYKWLKENGFSDQLARFCLSHVGTGITEDEAKEMAYLDLNLNHMPRTTEEIIVAFADKFTSKSRKGLCLNSIVEIEEQIKSYGPAHFDRWVEWKKVFGVPKLFDAKNMVDVFNAAWVIKNGGLVIFPTDTVYILAVDPTNQKAVDKLIAFKDRWPGKAISVAVDSVKMAEKYVCLNNIITDLMANLLPGPFTLVIDGKHQMAKGIEAENGTLGIRIPDNKMVMDLVKALGRPVTATSANLSGRTPHYSVESLMKTLSQKKKNMIDLVVDAGKLPKNKPSTVIDLTKPEIKILRRGDLIVGKSKTLVSKSERETEKIGEYLFKKHQKNKPLVFGLSGDLGCGKTVFSRAIGKYLGVEGKITSPTFVIFNEYKIPKGLFLHFDLYRITTEQELEEINFLEQFGKNTISCIEWPEIMGKENLEKLKKMVNYVPVNFRYVDEKTREIEY